MYGLLGCRSDPWGGQKGKSGSDQIQIQAWKGDASWDTCRIWVHCKQGGECTSTLKARYDSILMDKRLPIKSQLGTAVINLSGGKNQ